MENIGRLEDLHTHGDALFSRVVGKFYRVCSVQFIDNSVTTAIELAFQFELTFFSSLETKFLWQFG